MRVLFVSDWGVNPYQRLLVKELERAGVAVVEEAPSLRPWPHPPPGVVHLQNIRRFLTFQGLLLSIARCARFAVKLLRARLAGIAIVWTGHDLDHPARRHRRLDRAVTFLLARLVHGLIVHGAAAAAEVAAAARLKDRTKLHVIPLGHFAEPYENVIGREEARRRLGLPEQAMVFLFFGWIRPYKGVLELIRAFRRIGGGDAALLIAGAAPEPRYAAEVAAAVSGDARIRLDLRAIPDAGVQLYMNASDAVVFPYERVLTSGAAALAASFGKACIVADHGGLADAIPRDGAFFFDPLIDR
jgi:beta-1,4-mannosyltransferase